MFKFNVENKKTQKFSSYAVINLDFLKHNLGVAQKKAGDSKILAVVKADAYGHGAKAVSSALYESGVRHFAVANIDEALALRKNGLQGTILVLGPVLPLRLNDAAENDISVTVDSSESLAFAAAFTEASGKKLKIHIALNTGMNRIGFEAYDYGEIGDDGSRLCESLLDAVKVLKSNRLLITEGIFSHLCDADNDDCEYTERQFERFEKTVSQLSAGGINFTYRHICNSAGTMKYSERRYDLVRFGIGLYGYEFPEDNLLPVMSFKTHVAHITAVKKGDTVGYGRDYIAARDMRTATITAGYADGFNRLLSNRGFVVIRGKRAPIVGRICMDMTMVDVTDIPEAALFDEVTIIGSDGGEVITADEIAENCGTISYEILCSVGKRVPRTYIENGVEKDI